MTEISRKSLFAKLNKLAFQSIESATVLCKLRGNPYVDLAHWASHLIELPDSDWHRIIRAFELDAGKVIVQVNQALENLPTGANGIRDLSDDLLHATERAWVYGSLMYGRDGVRTADLLIALLKTPELKKQLVRISPELARIEVEKLCADLSQIIKDSPEQQMDKASHAGEPGQASNSMPSAVLGGSEALARYTVNMTELARNSQMDPVTGRENEVRQMVDILLRRRQNNPLIAGEAGVGKTAVVEGFAQMVAAGSVPPSLRDVEVLSLDLGLLQAGASMKGEFEQRLRQVIDEVQASIKPIVLFIDEIHTLVGAGGAAGTSDAANLLKPALARGQLRTIGATTWTEYKKYIEKDPALTRRFQVIQVDEPSPEKAIAMLEGLGDQMAAHHQVNVLREAIEAAVNLSHRYIPARQLPDKAIGLLDTACARVAVSQYSDPAQLEDLKARASVLESTMNRLQHEQSHGADHQERMDELSTQIVQLAESIDACKTQWISERDLYKSICEVRLALDQSLAESDSQESNLHLKDQLSQLKSQLKEVQGESGLIHAEVNSDSVAAVVAEWTGIPVGRMLKDEVNQVLKLDEILGARIMGQDHALASIAQRIQVSRAKLDDPSKPVGVFMLAGTSGVGKTETALALAEALYGGEHNLITINMSEFQEAHTVSSLKGSPPGYVGYGEGGVLTEAVRRKPYSVVLLDEVEKAHSDVHELFFQVFDKGWMEDGEGRKIDFKNTLIILTTNVGTSEIMRTCQGGKVRPAPDLVQQAIRPALLEVFPPALLGRLSVVPYYPLDQSMLEAIIRLQVERVVDRLSQNHKISTQIDDSVFDLILARCNESDSGGRVVHSILSQTVLPQISRLLLELTLDGKSPTDLFVGVKDAVLDYQFT